MSYKALKDKWAKTIRKMPYNKDDREYYVTDSTIQHGYCPQCGNKFIAKANIFSDTNMRATLSEQVETEVKIRTNIVFEKQEPNLPDKKMVFYYPIDEELQEEK